MTLLEKFTAASAEYFSRLEMDNLSPHTLAAYRNAHGSFAAYLSASGEQDPYAAAVGWRKALHDRGLAPSTVRQYMTDLNIFFAAASHRSYPSALRFEESPIDKNLTPKLPERPYEIILTDEQVKALYRNEAPAPRFKPTWARNWAMVMLFLNEKIRNAELRALRLSDVDMLHHILTVRSGKGRKFREVDLCPLTEYAITQYLNSGLRPDYLTDEDFLFGTTAAHEQGAVHTRAGAERWHQGGQNWASGIVERTVYAVAGVRGCRSHDLRHVGSRVCLNAGQSMEQLQGQLGHSNFSTTQIYCSRLGSHRARDSAKTVLEARDAAAKAYAEQAEQREQSTPKLLNFAG